MATALGGVVPGAGAGTVAREAPLAGWSIVVPHVTAGNWVDRYDIVTSSHPAVVQTLVRVEGRLDPADTFVAWSPDGTKVALRDPSGRSKGLYVMSTRGGKGSLLVRGGGWAPAVWSPDGTRLAFGRTCGSGTTACKAGLYLGALNGDPVKRVLAAPPSPIQVAGPRISGAIRRPGATLLGSQPISWAPDGKSLVCFCGGELRVVSSDGARSHVLAVTEVRVGPFVAWSASGRYLAYLHHCGQHEIPAQDEYCAIGFVGSPGTRPAPPHPPICVSPGSTIPALWTSDDTLLVAPWGCSPGRGTLFAVDPRTGTARRLSNSTVGAIATGSDGILAVLTGRVGTTRSTLFISDRHGRILRRVSLPIGANGAIITLSPPG